MFSWFKKYFIPHEGNDHRPFFLQTYNIRIVVLVIIFIEVFTFFIPTFNYISRLTSENIATVLPAVLSTLTNEERQTEKLSTLIVNPLLTKAAELKAEDMATKGYFAHTSPEGKTPWYWIDQVGYDYQYAGENLAINFTDSEDVTNAWMQSPTHRANIEKDKYTEMGTGIATGMYEGKETVFVTQIYASPNVFPVFITNKKVKENSTAVTTPTSTNVLGAETTNNTLTPKPTFMQKTFASPKSSTNQILLIILAIVVLALLLNIFIKMKQHHPDLITNGLVVVAIIGAVLVTNNYISKSNMIILESADYSNNLNGEALTF